MARQFHMLALALLLAALAAAPAQAWHDDAYLPLGGSPTCQNCQKTTPACRECTH